MRRFLSETTKYWSQNYHFLFVDGLSGQKKIWIAWKREMAESTAVSNDERSTHSSSLPMMFFVELQHQASCQNFRWLLWNSVDWCAKRGWVRKRENCDAHLLPLPLLSRTCRRKGQVTFLSIFCFLTPHGCLFWRPFFSSLKKGKVDQRTATSGGGS